MISFGRAVSAEALKQRRTVALWLVAIAPTIIVVVRYIEWAQHGQVFLYPGANPWTRWTQSVLVIWSMLMLPLFIVLETALLSSLEHAEKQWKHLFVLPIPRWTVYAAKQLTALVLIGLSMLVLWVEIPLAGMLLRFAGPELDFTALGVPWLEISRLILLTFLAAGMMSAIHTWVSMRSPSFTFAIGAGVAMIFFGLIVSSTQVGTVYPWSLPLNVVWGQGERQVSSVLLGVVECIVASIVGGWEFIHRDIV